jgi:hypothetical protein
MRERERDADRDRDRDPRIRDARSRITMHLGFLYP